MKIQNIQHNKLNKNGFSLVEIIVVIAIMVVLLAIAAPSLLKHVENSRVQKDESAMGEVCNAVQLAMADSMVFDEVCSYAVPNNYVTYSDSSGVYGAQYTDEEFWAPDGAGNAVTITFNPDDNGNYVLAEGLVNNMTCGNGSVADSRIAEGVQQCTLAEMGNQKLYAQLTKTIGSTFSEKSSTYKNSSYTIFIKLDVVNSVKRANVYGEWNGTNLSEDSPASLGSGTIDYTDNGEAIVTKPTGGTTTPNFSNSDLTGSGAITNPDDTKPDPSLNPDDGTTPVNGDTYLSGDYTYTYHSFYGGWNVAINTEVTDKQQTSYGSILESINGEPVSRMDDTFLNCARLANAPAIPNGVKRLSRTFSGCTSLTQAPVIPNSVTYMENTFYDCRILTKAPVIPNSVTYMDKTFGNCSSLTEAPVIPDSVTQLTGTFRGCTSLVKAPVIPNSVTSLYAVFTDCKNLTEAPVIPDSVTSLYQTFSGCSSLVNAPVIPSSVTNMCQAFSGCTKLSGTIIINGNISNISYSYNSCFKNVDFKSQNIILTGESTMLDVLGATGKNYCAACNGKCQNNH